MRKKQILDNSFTIVDHRDSPGEVLRLVDLMLVPFGLEIATVNMDDDQYYFKVEKRREA